jgi:P-type Ca2+ transporter type 2B
MSKSNHN